MNFQKYLRFVMLSTVLALGSSLSGMVSADPLLPPPAVGTYMGFSGDMVDYDLTRTANAFQNINQDLHSDGLRISVSMAAMMPKKSTPAPWRTEEGQYLKNAVELWAKETGSGKIQVVLNDLPHWWWRTSHSKQVEQMTNFVGNVVVAVRTGLANYPAYDNGKNISYQLWNEDSNGGDFGRQNVAMLQTIANELSEESPDSARWLGVNADDVNWKGFMDKTVKGLAGAATGGMPTLTGIGIKTFPGSDVLAFGWEAVRTLSSRINGSKTGYARKVGAVLETGYATWNPILANEVLQQFWVHNRLGESLVATLTELNNNNDHSISKVGWKSWSDSSVVSFLPRGNWGIVEKGNARNKTRFVNSQGLPIMRSKIQMSTQSSKKKFGPKGSILRGPQNVGIMTAFAKETKFGDATLKLYFDNFKNRKADGSSNIPDPGGQVVVYLFLDADGTRGNLQFPAVVTSTDNGVIAEVEIVNGESVIALNPGLVAWNPDDGDQVQAGNTGEASDATPFATLSTNTGIDFAQATIVNKLFMNGLAPVQAKVALTPMSDGTLTVDFQTQKSLTMPSEQKFRKKLAYNTLVGAFGALGLVSRFSEVQQELRTATVALDKAMIGGCTQAADCQAAVDAASSAAMAAYGEQTATTATEMAEATVEAVDYAASHVPPLNVIYVPVTVDKTIRDNAGPILLWKGEQTANISAVTQDASWGEYPPTCGEYDSASVVGMYGMVSPLQDGTTSAPWEGYEPGRAYIWTNGIDPEVTPQYADSWCMFVGATPEYGDPPVLQNPTEGQSHLINKFATPGYDVTIPAQPKFTAGDLPGDDNTVVVVLPGSQLTAEETANAKMMFNEGIHINGDPVGFIKICPDQTMLIVPHDPQNPSPQCP